ncbi:hypothetical protein [Massilia oculi]|uniref:hypothetical protein n=1 Tax=Massilia oculi TaxID=945844 RepID=UPI001AAE812E|nr:hypothetical protein [Massilia oculi]
MDAWPAQVPVAHLLLLPTTYCSAAKCSSDTFQLPGTDQRQAAQSTIISPSTIACISHGARDVTQRGLSRVSPAGAPHAKPLTAGSQKSQNITAVNDSRNRLQQHHLTFTVLINPDATAPPGR